MLAFGGADIRRALFVSPVVNMECLIWDMMTWAGMTEDILCEKGEISTDFGETLSWWYLTWVREHPVENWACPTAILYVGRDNLTSRETVIAFAAKYHTVLTIMENGEHWSHTPEQLQALVAWERDNI